MADKPNGDGKRAGDDAAKRAGDDAAKRAGDAAATQAGDDAEKRADDDAERRAGDAGAKRADDDAERRASDAGAKRAGDDAAKGAGDAGAKRAGDDAAKRAGDGDDAAKRAGDDAAKRAADALRADGGDSGESGAALDGGSLSRAAVERLTANLSTLAEAMPALLEQFRTLARSLRAGAVAGKIVDVAEEQRLAAFVQLVKMLGPAREGPAQALDVARFVDATLAVARAELTRRARLIKVYAPAPPVMATERQLGQLMLDLLMHVTRAIPEGDPDRHRLTLRVGTTDSGWALIELEPAASDSGRATDSAVAADSAAVDSAVAMDLVPETVRALVAELGGRLRIARESGRATTLRVELPPARAPDTNIKA